jgi:cysteinyl-tRNA synthetase
MSKFIQLLNRVQKTLLFSEEAVDPFKAALQGLTSDEQAIASKILAQTNKEGAPMMTTKEQEVWKKYQTDLQKRLQETLNSPTSVKTKETSSKEQTSSSKEQSPQQTKSTDTTSASSFIPPGVSS